MDSLMVLITVPRQGVLVAAQLGTELILHHMVRLHNLLVLGAVLVIAVV